MILSIMNMLAMRFAVVRFMPHIQTREFANVGIILICPNTGFFDYKLETEYQHLSCFFRYFNASVFEQALICFSDELDRIKYSLEKNSYKKPETVRALLDHLARPRDAIVCTSDIGVTTGSSEQEELDHLFDYYIGHELK